MEAETIQLLMLVAVISGAFIRFLQNYTKEGKVISMANIGTLVTGFISSVIPMSLDIFSNMQVDSNLSLTAVIIGAFSSGYVLTSGASYTIVKAKTAYNKYKSIKP